MDRSRADEVLREWTTVARTARRPLSAPRPRVTRTALPAGLLAAAAIALVVVFAIGFGSRSSLPAAGSSSPKPSASPTVEVTANPTVEVTASSSAPSATPAILAGAFRPTGSMTAARYGQTATRLADGRVLIAGGGLNETDANIQDAYASAELYDPASGTFKATGSMHFARGNHTATLLSNGRVLIAGGSSEFGKSNLTQAEIYDPASGKFSLTGRTGTVRSGATAVLLHDGRVLIAGGFRGGTPPGALASAELYDPATGKFSPTGSMSVARMYDTASLLQDGRVLVAGGWDDTTGTIFASAELYDPATGKFSLTGSMSAGREFPFSGLLPDGRVLVAGGENFNADNIDVCLTSAELYDPKTGTFAATSSTSTSCSGSAGTALSDGRVLSLGGSDGTNFVLSGELYDPRTGTFSETGAMSTVQRGATMTLLADGRVLVAGGFDADQNALAIAELFEP